MDQALRELLNEPSPWPMHDGENGKADSPQGSVQALQESADSGSGENSHFFFDSEGAPSSAGTALAAGSGEEGVKKRKTYQRAKTEKLAEQNRAAQRRHRMRKKELEKAQQDEVQGLKDSLDRVSRERDEMARKVQLLEGLLQLRDNELELLKPGGTSAAENALVVRGGGGGPASLEGEAAPLHPRSSLSVSAGAALPGSIPPLDFWPEAFEVRGLNFSSLMEGLGAVELPAPSSDRKEVGPCCSLPGYMHGDLHDEGKGRTAFLEAQRNNAFRTLIMALNAVSDAVSICEANHTANVVWVNDRHVELTGYSVEEALSGRSVRSMSYSELNHESVYDGMCSTVLAGQQWKNRYFNKRKDGTHFLQETTVFVIRDAGQVPIFAVHIRRPLDTPEGAAAAAPGKIGGWSSAHVISTPRGLEARGGVGVAAKGEEEEGTGEPGPLPPAEIDFGTLERSGSLTLDMEEVDVLMGGYGGGGGLLHGDSMGGLGGLVPGPAMAAPSA